jgi:hypothetical protein
MYAAYYGGSSDDDEDESETEIHWATQPHIAKMYAIPTTTSPINRDMPRATTDATANTTTNTPVSQYAYPVASRHSSRGSLSGYGRVEYDPL